LSLESTPFISSSTSFWYQFRHFRLTCSFTRHFFLFSFTTLYIYNSISLSYRNRIFVRSAVMCSYNNCSISRVLDSDWFACFYHRTEQGNRRQQNLHTDGIAPLTICFFNLSPVNAKFTSLSYVHASVQTVMRLNIG